MVAARKPAPKTQPRAGAKPSRKPAADVEKTREVARDVIRRYRSALSKLD